MLQYLFIGEVQHALNNSLNELKVKREGYNMQRRAKHELFKLGKPKYSWHPDEGIEDEKSLQDWEEGGVEGGFGTSNL